MTGDCVCGHSKSDHLPEWGCDAHCLCVLCPDGTENDCWCAGFKPIAEVYA